MRRMLLALFVPIGLLAQFDPDGAQVNLYFPQLADGGGPSEQWQTTFVLLNAHESLPAGGQLALFNSSGNPLALDLGNGSRSVHEFFVPARGTVTLRSRAMSPQVVTGWARGFGTLPLQATVLYRLVRNGVPVVELSAPATLPSPFYWSPANRDLGVAIANPFTNRTVTLNLRARNELGVTVGETRITLLPRTHRAFNLSGVLPSLPATFSGSISILGVDARDAYVAWSLNVDRGLISTLPVGRGAWPISHEDRIWLVYLKVLFVAEEVAAGFGVTLFSPLVELHISGDQVINAYASGGRFIQINLATSELISDSPSELAFVVAHELAHIIQQRARRNLLLPNQEEDADFFGMLFCLAAGFDPYAGAGALAKLSMASGQSGLIAQILAAPPHGSFNTRIQSMFRLLQALCSDPQFGVFCSLYKSQIHPSFPPGVPLAEPIPVEAQERPQIRLPQMKR